MALEFDPYRRPPAARLLAIVVTALLVTWMTAGTARFQDEQLRRDPEKFYKHVSAVAHRSQMANVVVSLILITVIVFAVDGLTSLFGRWLRERQIPDETAKHSGDSHSTRAGALLGDSAPPTEPH